MLCVGREGDLVALVSEDVLKRYRRFVTMRANDNVRYLFSLLLYTFARHDPASNTRGREGGAFPNTRTQ